MAAPWEDVRLSHPKGHNFPFPDPSAFPEVTQSRGFRGSGGRGGFGVYKHPPGPHHQGRKWGPE